MKRMLDDIDCCCCFIIFLSFIQAIPINQDAIGTNLAKSDNSTDLENVCVHENAIYAEGQNFTTSNPCEVCTCDPPGFSCTLSSCDLKPACKAIHKANQCCPEYVCECERNGKIYGNGEKVEEPNPCKVCYCKGGEIKCALVTCYTRDDCEPGYVAGVCCPKYDHCPPLEMMKNKSTTPQPAQVIISDLKTESAITVKHKKIVPQDHFVSTSEKVEMTSSSTETKPTVTTTEDDRESTTEGTTIENEGVKLSTEDFDRTTETTEETETSTVDWETTDVTEGTEGTSFTDSDGTTIVNNVTTTECTTYFNATDYMTTEDGEYTTVENEQTENVTAEYSTTEMEATEEDHQGEQSRNVVKVIVPKTLKKDVDQFQNLDGPAPIVVMISAEQIQFLKLAEEPPMYVENPDSDSQRTRHDHLGVIVVPKTTPTTVEMVKVLDGTSKPELSATTEDANNSLRFNDTGIIQER